MPCLKIYRLAGIWTLSFAFEFAVEPIVKAKHIQPFAETGEPRARTVERAACSFPEKVAIFHKRHDAHRLCKRNIEMTPPCKVEVTLPRVVGSGEVHRGGGVVDEQAGVQPS